MTTFAKTPRATGQSGFTLLELLLVIGVAALLLIGGIATYRLVSDGNKGTESTRLLLTIRQESQTMAQQQGGNYVGIGFVSTDNGATSATGGASPLVTSGVLRIGQRNPFNGVIEITPNTAGDNLDISFENVSKSQCIKLVQAINNANEIVSVTVNATTALTTFPITAADASGACTGTTDTVMWTLP